MSFEQIGVSSPLVAALTKQGLSEPTPIQTAGLPEIFAGKDCVLCAETGSGKTLAYLIPLYQLLEVEKTATQVLVVAPTHELALQIHRVSCDLAQNAALAVRNVLLLGGTAVDRQIEKLKKKPQIVIGTLGRVFELAERGKLKLKDLKSVVVDEADRLLAGDSLDMMRRLLAATPPERQLIFVSATEQRESGEVIDELSPQVVRVQIAEAAVNPRISHLYLVVEERDKPEVLRKLIHATKASKALVFVHRNETAEIVSAKLTHHKISVADLHGAYEKEERKQAMLAFRSGKASVLIASDVAARGLDIPAISHVFNLDMPSKAKDYLHRVGRTARAGATGIAISLLVEAELRLVRRFSRDLGFEMREVTLQRGELIEIHDAAHGE